MESHDRARFTASLDKLLATANGTFGTQADHQHGAYWRTLERYPLDIVHQAMTDALADETGRITPAKLRQRCDELRRPEVERAAELARERERDQVEAERIARTRFGPIYDDPDFRAMLYLAQTAYARKVTGQTGELTAFTGGKFREYRGAFDWQSVVRAAPGTRGKSEEAHRAGWRTFWQLLREEWEAWQGAENGA